MPAIQNAPPGQHRGRLLARPHLASSHNLPEPRMGGQLRRAHQLPDRARGHLRQVAGHHRKTGRCNAAARSQPGPPRLGVQLPCDSGQPPRSTSIAGGRQPHPDRFQVITGHAADRAAPAHDPGRRRSPSERIDNRRTTRHVNCAAGASSASADGRNVLMLGLVHRAVDAVSRWWPPGLPRTGPGHSPGREPGAGRCTPHRPASR